MVTRSSDSSKPAPRRSSWLSVLFSLTILGLAACGRRHVFALEPGLDSLSHAAGCAPPSAAPVASPSAAPAAHSGIAAGAAPPCYLQLRRWERSPLGRTFVYEGGRGLVHVQCWREYWALGDYHCKRTL